MTDPSDPTVTVQYRDSTNLDARIRLHRLYSTNTRGWYPWVIDQLVLSGGMRILELGCGPGALWQGNTGRLPVQTSLFLTDYSIGMVQAAQRNLLDPRFSFSVVDAQFIPFPDASFDAVMANHMLYHIPDRDQALVEIRRVLKPGGRLYAATNGMRHMAELDDLVQRLAPQFTISSVLSSFAASFTLENGIDQLNRHFERVRLSRYPDALHITHASPLVDYVLSMSANARRGALPGEIEAFTRRVEEELALNGVIRISKDSGMFIASME